MSDAVAQAAAWREILANQRVHDEKKKMEVVLKELNYADKSYVDRAYQQLLRELVHANKEYVDLTLQQFKKELGNKIMN